MAKSIIVYGVPGCKTRFAQRIADHFGLIIIPGEIGEWYASGHIYFREPEKLHPQAEEWARSFQSIADEINALIPLTDWQSGPPPMVGEWNASRFEHEENRMWWNGEFWSASFYHDTPEKQRNTLAGKKNSAGHWAHGVKWRGLSQEPIKVTE